MPQLVFSYNATEDWQVKVMNSDGTMGYPEYQYIPKALPYEDEHSYFIERSADHTRVLCYNIYNIIYDPLTYQTYIPLAVLEESNPHNRTLNQTLWKLDDNERTVAYRKWQHYVTPQWVYTTLFIPHYWHSQDILLQPFTPDNCFAMQQEQLREAVATAYPARFADLIREAQHIQQPISQPSANVTLAKPMSAQNIQKISKALRAKERAKQIATAIAIFKSLISVEATSSAVSNACIFLKVNSHIYKSSDVEIKKFFKDSPLPLKFCLELILKKTARLSPKVKRALLKSNYSPPRSLI